MKKFDIPRNRTNIILNYENILSYEEPELIDFTNLLQLNIISYASDNQLKIIEDIILKIENDNKKDYFDISVLSSESEKDKITTSYQENGEEEKGLMLEILKIKVFKNSDSLYLLEIPEHYSSNVERIVKDAVNKNIGHLKDNEGVSNSYPLEKDDIPEIAKTIVDIIYNFQQEKEHEDR